MSTNCKWTKNSQETCQQFVKELYESLWTKNSNKKVREFGNSWIQDQQILFVNLALCFSIRIVKQHWIELKLWQHNFLIEIHWWNIICSSSRYSFLSYKYAPFSDFEQKNTQTLHAVKSQTISPHVCFQFSDQSLWTHINDFFARLLHPAFWRLYFPLKTVLQVFNKTWRITYHSQTSLIIV